MPTGAELFVETLAELGIRTVFTLVGDHLNQVLSCASRAGFRIVGVRHESAAVHAADALARLQRRPAVALVTGGPGHTNAVTGIATAAAVGSPVIAVSGAPPQAQAGRPGFQVIDQVSIVRPLVKWAAEVQRPDQIRYFVTRAYQEANAPRKGPVHLTVPADVFAGQVAQPLPGVDLTETGAPRPDARLVERALELLRNAQRPVVIGGSGLWWADAGPVLKIFLERTRLPLFTLTLARGLIPDGELNCFGYGDPALSKLVRRAFPLADVVLVLGKRIDYRLALGGQLLFSPEAKFIQVDIHAQELGANRELAVGIHADVRATLEALVDAVGKDRWPERRDWLQRLEQLEREWKAELEQLAQDRTQPIHPAAFFFELRKHLPEVIYSWDGGDFVHWGRAILPARRAGAWLRLGPMATIGAGLPNAIAMQLHYPNERVVMITGDGSLGFYLAELDTLVRERLPVIVIVGNDGGWGIERELQRELQGTTVACELQRSRYELVMEAFGGAGETIGSLDQVGPAVQRALRSEVPYLLNVQIRGVRSPFTEWALLRRRSG